MEEEVAVMYPKDPPWYKPWMVPTTMCLLFFLVALLALFKRCASCRRGDNSPTIHPASDPT
ncbi:PREDICTED: uncharacterized protein LOC109116965 [Tarenaya hassleriana]|uniref:uncharacterized protein LOC109116965 n=1 Tax=Tarenaya hassleriana TaxID=28532 RepID=UPI0008FD6EFB|nr:PREDICTED: uncharacterized protein LOC109116965 [Tarenaya hassleriana]